VSLLPCFPTPPSPIPNSRPPLRSRLIDLLIGQAVDALAISWIGQAAGSKAGLQRVPSLPVAARGPILVLSCFAAAGPDGGYSADSQRQIGRELATVVGPR
jgi:hypothetical protein